MAEPLIVILGAAVRSDGQASAALLRRIEGGRVLALAHPRAMLFCSGAVGRFGPSEASIMAQVLTAGGVAADRLVLDEDSRDTLQTGLAAARHVLSHDLDGAIVCTDRYHVLRSRLILELLGVKTRDGGVAAGIPQMGWFTWLRMRVRELPAIPYDGALALWKRRGLVRGLTARG